MAYIGWAANVNKHILDSTVVSIGSDSVIEESLDSGKKITRLKNSACPDVFNVVMDFDWVEQDTNGLTEKDRFYNWYKYQHCFGVNPVEFPKIILGAENTSGTTAFYKITAGAQGQKNGELERFQMTFTEVFSGSVTIPSETAVLDHITAYTDRVEAVFSSSPSTTPVSSGFALSITFAGVTSSITPARYEFDGSMTETLWLDSEITTSGNYTFSITYGSVTKTDSLLVGA